MILNVSYFSILSWFLIYSFLGWVVEVVFHAVTKGHIVNRGFLNGPVCPVYGFGAVAILMGAQFINTDGITQVSTFIVFISGFILATLIELIAGWMLDVLFHARWWDYRKEPFNFKGYICLRFSILWGLGTVLLAKVVHPMIARFSTPVDIRTWMWIVVGFLYLFYFIDFVITTAVLIGINKKLKKIDALQKSLRTLSDAMSSGIGESALSTTQFVQQGRVQAQLARNTMQDAWEETRDAAQDALWVKKNDLEKQVQTMRESMVQHSYSMLARVLNAAPDWIHDDYPELVEQLRYDIMNRKRH